MLMEAEGVKSLLQFFIWEVNKLKDYFCIFIVWCLLVFSFQWYELKRARFLLGLKETLSLKNFFKKTTKFVKHFKYKKKQFLNMDR